MGMRVFKWRGDVDIEGVLKWRGDVEIGMKPEGIEIGVWLLNWVELLSEGEGV